MSRIFFALPGNEKLTESLANKCNSELGVAIIRHFPDGETYIKIESDVKGKQILIVCSFHHPDEKIIPVCFLSQTARDLGAQNVTLIAPYLSYMRQDVRFYPGEGLTSAYFAKIISSHVDLLVTIDPHLHRIQSLSEIYSIPTIVISTTELISKWIKENIKQPLLIGPDIESKQWVSEIAKNAGAPCIILHKIRKSDTEVEISIPDIEKYIHNTPVLVDDIISTARTMISTIRHLQNSGMPKPVCISIHGIFAGNSFDDLINTGIDQLVTCNTIIHQTNQINIDQLLSSGILQSTYQQGH
jgi:ribose-phosphate pyrophosphokinase